MKNDVIMMDKFIPRDYQWGLIDAIFKKGYKNALCVWPRRAGKDLTTFLITIGIALSKTCLVYYILPTYSQAKKAIFQAISTDGIRFLDYIPPEVIKSINSQEMKITLKNNSIIQLIGGDSYDTSLVGSNPYVCVFSEFSLMDERAYEYASPILAANNGICIILYTPRGFNYAYKLHQSANRWPDWYISHLSLDVTKHISAETLAREREKHSEEFIQQEWFCSYIRGVEGAVYGRYMDELRNKERITIVDWEPTVKVHSSWDLGIGKNMVVLLFQCVRQEIRIIDVIQLKDGALPEYIAELKKKPYIYGSHIGPHDLRVHDMGTNITRWGIAHQLGIDFIEAPSVGIENGIEATKAIFHRLWIDEKKCDVLIRSLDNYRYEFDDKKQEYSRVPMRDWTGHFCDGLRYLAISLDHISDGLTPAMLEQNFQKAKAAQSGFTNDPFTNNFPHYR